MAQPFIQARLYTDAEIADAVGEHEVEGSFRVGKEAVALVVSIGDGLESPQVPTRSSLHWPYKAPLRVTERHVSTWLFANEGTHKRRFLGTAYASQYKQGVREISDVHFEFTPPLARQRWLEQLGWLAAPNTQPFPEEEIVRMTTASSPNECLHALETFVERWYRVSLEATPEPHAETIGPPILHRLLELARAVPHLFQHNELVPAESLELDDSRVTFLIENQAVCSWATEAGGEDPRVWYRNNEPDEPWIEEPVRLSRFMVQAVVFEAVLGARFGGQATAIPPQTLTAIRTRLAPIGGEAWSWCGARIYARDGALALVTESHGQADLFLAAITPHALTPFMDLVDENWDRVAF